MGGPHWIFLLLLVGGAAFAETASEEVSGTTGMALCCKPVYWNCYEQCPTRKDRTDPGCISRCEAAHCVARTGTCAKASPADSESAESSPGETTGGAGSGVAGSGIVRKEKTGTVHYDGKLTGPGTIHFEALNLDTTNRTLAINGVIFGKLGVAMKILKTSQVYMVVPGKSTKFTLEVSPREFEGWNQQMTQLTIAIGFADERERDRWRFENLLTQRDAESARPGEFQVKGAFSPTGSAPK